MICWYARDAVSAPRNVLQVVQYMTTKVRGTPTWLRTRTSSQPIVSRRFLQFGHLALVMVLPITRKQRSHCDD